jgi:hypothetical protein
MAFIMGLLSEKEERELTRRGWDVEVPDSEIAKSLCLNSGVDKFRMVWVDNDMFDIMNGPDWDKGEKVHARKKVLRRKM